MVILLLGGIWWGGSPRLFIVGEQGLIATMPAYQGKPLEISFIHSVQKTPVEEYLEISEDLSQIVLKSTRYHSFGVGLPFQEADAIFYQDGDDFVMDNMNRRFDSLSLRTGVGTQLTVNADGRAFPMYEMFPPGYRIDIFVAPGIYYVKVKVQELLQVNGD